MKAWLVREEDEFCATVVFAETRGKPKRRHCIPNVARAQIFSISKYTENRNLINIILTGKQKWIGLTRKTALLLLKIVDSIVAMIALI